MPVTDADEARVVRLLAQDIVATLGPGHENLVRHAAAHARTLRNEPAAYVAKVVEDVQQELHDRFIDTTWPACPMHANHPLWLRDEQWVCESAATTIAALGSLGRDATPKPMG